MYQELNNLFINKTKATNRFKQIKQKQINSQKSALKFQDLYLRNID